MKAPTLILMAMALLLAPVAQAKVDVGDKPELQFQAVDGSPINLKQLEGKIVVVDFWATWCGPCMAEAPHMVDLNRKYHEQGLQIIGISLDTSKQKLLATVSEKEFDWPQYFDGKGGGEVAGPWGVTGIPCTFIIGPDGDVLWRGHPGNIDGPLADAFAKHPPRLVDQKTLAQAKTILDSAEQSLKGNDAAGAMKLLSKFPTQARKDKAIDQRASDITKQLESFATTVLSQADALASEQKYTDAAAKLEEVSHLAPLPVAAKANEKLRKLMADPQARKALEAAEASTHADAALASARKLQSEKQDEKAYTAYKAIVANYPDTDSAKAAAQEVARYEKDAKFIKTVTSNAASAKAKSLLSMAQNYENAGRSDLAKKKYQAIIDQFPGTSFADQAKAAIKKLPE